MAKLHKEAIREDSDQILSSQISFSHILIPVISVGFKLSTTRRKARLKGFRSSSLSLGNEDCSAVVPISSALPFPFPLEPGRLTGFELGSGAHRVNILRSFATFDVKFPLALCPTATYSTFRWGQCMILSITQERISRNTLGQLSLLVRLI